MIANHRVDGLDALSGGDLRRMSRAASEFLDLVSQAYEARRPILAELLGDGSFLQWEHYPPDDLFDPKARVLTFYHAHSPEDRQSAEHGHFHCFVECSEVSSDTPALAKPRKRTGRRLCHVAGVSVDMSGVPTGLFIPNQWVTGEWLYPAPVASGLMRRFSRVGKSASRPLQWIARLITLFEPQLDALLRERDRQLGSGRGAGRRARDRSLEILAETAIDIDGQIESISAEMRRRKTRASRDRLPSRQGDSPPLQ